MEKVELELGDTFKFTARAVVSNTKHKLIIIDQDKASRLLDLVFDTLVKGCCEFED